jgi:hypothetical protein
MRIDDYVYECRAYSRLWIEVRGAYEGCGFGDRSGLYNITSNIYIVIRAYYCKYRILLTTSNF